MRRTALAAAYYEVLPDQAEVVREVFGRYTNGGDTIAGITHWLNERGLPTRTGQGRWERSTVWAMLRNPAYKGLACFGKTESKPRQRITRRLRQKGTVAQPSGAHSDTPRESWIEIPVSALVDEQTFAWAAERLEANKHFRAGHATEPSLLQGLLVCEQCSHAYYRTSTRTSKRKIIYYRCLGSDGYRWSEGRRCDSHPVRQDYLDNLVWEQVVRLLEEPDLVRQELERRLDNDRRLHPSQGRRDTLSHELTRLARSSQKLMDAYQEDLLQLDELRPRLRDLRQRQAALEAEQRSLAAQQVNEEALLQITHTVDDFLQRLNASAQRLDTKQRQQVLRLVVREVVVGQDSIRIRHSIPAARSGPDGSPRTGQDPPGYLLRTGSHHRALRGAYRRRRPAAFFGYPGP